MTVLGHCRKRVRQALVSAGRRAGAEWLLRRPAHRLICPLYHTVRSTTPSWWGPRYRIKTPAEFELDLDQWLRWGKPVSLSDLIAWSRGKRDCPRGFFLSFDDGYRELYEVVAPILRRKGVPATFFLVSSLLDNAAVFCRDHLGLISQAMEGASPAALAEVHARLKRAGLSWAELWASRQPQPQLIAELSALLEVDAKAWLEREQPYLTTAQASELLQAGFALGAHSIDHPLYAGLAPEEQVRQTRVSMDFIVSRFGLDHRAFAFPYGEFGVDPGFVISMVKRGAVEIFFGTDGVHPDARAPRLVQRLSCEDHRGSLREHLTSHLADSWVRSLRKGKRQS